MIPFPLDHCVNANYGLRPDLAYARLLLWRQAWQSPYACSVPADDAVLQPWSALAPDVFHADRALILKGFDTDIVAGRIVHDELLRLYNAELKKLTDLKKHGKRSSLARSPALIPDLHQAPEPAPVVDLLTQRGAGPPGAHRVNSELTRSQLGVPAPVPTVPEVVGYLNKRPTTVGCLDWEIARRVFERYEFTAAEAADAVELGKRIHGATNPDRDKVICMLALAKYIVRARISNRVGYLRSCKKRPSDQDYGAATHAFNAAAEHFVNWNNKPRQTAQDCGIQGIWKG